MLEIPDVRFNSERPRRELREYTAPDVIDEHLSADQEALETWHGEVVSLPLPIMSQSKD